MGHAPRISVSMAIYAEQYGDANVSTSEQRTVVAMRLPPNVANVTEVEWLTLGAYLDAHVARALDDAKAQLRVLADQARARHAEEVPGG